MNAIENFFRERAKDLRRIAGHTRGDVELGDVQNEAWLVAAEIEKKRGYPVDYADSEDQESLIKRLYNRFVKYAEKHFRHAVKLDVDWDKEESSALGAVLARILTAPGTSSPDARIQKEQEGKDLVAAVQRSFSQASAYVLLLMRFDWDAPELAKYLHIGVATLRLKFKVAGIKVSVQPSLFDGVAFVAPDFRATVRQRASGARTHLTGSQCCWDF